MSPGFSTDFKELVRSRTDLVELVGETVSLKPLRGGSDYTGLCPFHDDHHPSFHVYPDRQSYRCWVCQEGGDCFSFVMKIEGVEFRDALEMLARRARLEVPGTRRPGRRDASAANVQQGKNQLLEILAWAESEFHGCLIKSPRAEAARAYLRERGFTDETISRFCVGYHPDDWQWLIERARGKFTAAQLFAARLVRERRDGSGYYDDFVNRLLFPIRDPRGRPVAFGGRILPGHRPPDAPKYLNSPESPLFAKSRLLYGLDVARDAVRRSETVVVVEGYTDCMMAQQYGLSNVVGTLGTALTETHVTALKRLARTVILVYDGDAAGRMAAERSLARFLSQDVDLRVLTLPGGLDPADFLAEQGADAFRAEVDQAVEAWQYKLHAVLDKYGLETVDARQRVLDDMLALIAQAPRLSGTIRENLLLSRLAGRIGLEERIVRQRLSELRKKPAGSPNGQPKVSFFSGSGGRTSRDDLLECELLQIVFAAPESIETIRQQVSADEFSNEFLKQLLQVCCDLAEQGIAPACERVTAALEDPELKRLAVMLDEWARDKGIARKLRDSVRPPMHIQPDHIQTEKDDPIEKTAAPDGFLEQALYTFQWRRRERLHESSKGAMAGLSGRTEGLDQDARALLRRANEYHEQRAAQKRVR